MSDKYRVFEETEEPTDLAVLYLGVELVELVLVVQRQALGLVALRQRLQQLVLNFS